MKKLFIFAAIAAIATVGCSKTETADVASSAMSFNAYTSAPTRVAEANITTLQGTGFTTYAYQHTAEYSKATDLAAFFTEKDATYTSTWSMEGGTYYWPYEKKVSFFAYNNVEATNTNNNVTNWSTTVTNTALPSFTYTVNTDAMEDFMVARNVDAVVGDGDTKGKVNFNFNHVLAQINFKAKGAETSNNTLHYTVNSITILGLKPTAVFTYSATNGVMGTWAAPTGDAVDYSYSFTPTTGDNKNEITLADSTPLMIMPQTANATTPATIEVTYKVTDNNNNTIFDNKKTVTLTDFNFEAGKKINFNLTLPTGSTAMTFTADVSNWEDADPQPEDKPLQ